MVIPKIASHAKQGMSLLNPATASQHDKLVKQSQRLVSQTFFGTLLKQMRDSPFKSEIFDGGHGGKAFSGLLDQHLADRMASGSGQKLVNAMVRKIEKNTGQRREPEAAKKSPTQSRFERSAYRKLPSGNRRLDVPTDFRA